MGTVSTVTIGAASYSVYALTADALTDADNYLDAKLGAGAWASATAADRNRALVSAARWLDRAIDFSGTKTVSTQALEWPRDSATCGTEPVTDGTVPDEVALAEFELAFVLIADATAQDAAGQGSNVKSAKAGSAKVEFFSSTLGSSLDTRLPTTANDLVKCFITNTIATGGAGFASGVDGTDACDNGFERGGSYS